MDRKTYMKDTYSKYWITAREKIYGFSKYDRNLCNYICEHTPKGGRLLEVAIGTGYPFGDFFQKAGYSVYGIDISPGLIEKCRELNPNINCRVGDAERLDYSNSYFDCTYCFHSTWYFPNLNKAIDEMLRVTHPAGLVIFDIQNRNNKKIGRAYHKKLSEHIGIRRIIRHAKNYAKNIAKIILRRGTPVWHLIVYEVPTYPENLYEHFKQIGISDFQVMVRKADDTLELKGQKGSFEEYNRLVFVVRK